MTFPTEGLLDPTELAGVLKGAGGLSGETVEDVHARALEHLEQAFEDSWRDPPVATANDCLVRVAQALVDSRKTSRAGQQLATTDAGTAGRAPVDPLEGVRPILARYVVPL